jgi:hypothetical protein
MADSVDKAFAKLTLEEDNAENKNAENNAVEDNVAEDNKNIVEDEEAERQLQQRIADKNVLKELLIRHLSCHTVITEEKEKKKEKKGLLIFQTTFQKVNIFAIEQTFMIRGIEFKKKCVNTLFKFAAPDNEVHILSGAECLPCYYVAIELSISDYKKYFCFDLIFDKKFITENEFHERLPIYKFSDVVEVLRMSKK